MEEQIEQEIVNDCDHCEAVEMGEVEWWEEDTLTMREVCLCPQCGDDFVFPFDKINSL